MSPVPWIFSRWRRISLGSLGCFRDSNCDKSHDGSAPPPYNEKWALNVIDEKPKVVTEHRLASADTTAAAEAIRPVEADMTEQSIAILPPSPKPRAPLYRAAKNGQNDAIRILLNAGADINETNASDWTPLRAAAQAGHIQTVKCLLDAGAIVDVCCNKGWTPLHDSVWRDRVQITKMLLEAGANVHLTTTRDSRTALRIAMSKRNVDLARLLLQHGADACSTDSKGYSPLHLAAREGDVEMIEMCVARGVNPDARTKTNWSALHAAAKHGHVECARWLVGHGVEVDVIEKHGWTPMALAADHGHTDVLEALVNAGAKMGARREQA